MKIKVFALFLLLSVIVAVGAVLSVMKQFSVTIAVAGTAAQLTNASLAATSITLIGCSAPQVTNTSAVWVSYGQSGSDLQAVRVNPGEIINLTLDPGQAFFSVSNVWFDVKSNNDGLTILYDQVR
ncbi:MAG: hypothetical protein JW384_00206 [Nitrosomonadaceae bacterium]|jgi:hypothetical protein|nr:hypothetical protein [Nitrosomonadaceae bacterium]